MTQRERREEILKRWIEAERLLPFETSFLAHGRLQLNVDRASGAIYDDTHRYLLWRRFGNEPVQSPVGFLMLNPSTADHEKDDPTIRRCTGFARDWGFGAFMVGNLHAFRTVSTKVLKAAAKEGRDTIGLLNDRYLDYMFEVCEFVVCAWGKDGPLLGRSAAIKERYKDRDLRYLRLTKQGEPGHPLYLPSLLKPQRWI